MNQKIAISVFLVLCGGIAPAATLHPIFRDGMVFAAGKPLRVYGSGTGRVKVAFRGETRTAEGGAEGWRVTFPPAEARGAETLTVELDGRRTELRDVRVGEVFLIAGQSNVRFTLGESTNDLSAWTDDPLLRCYTLPQPEKTPFAPSDGWVPFETARAKDWSALIALFGRERRAAGAPAFGAVGCYQGASVIESWIPAETAAKRVVAREKLHGDHGHPKYARWNAPGQLYRDTFRAIGPFSFTGVVWYQGESNTGSPEEAKAYEGWLADLVTTWRRDLGDESLRFLVVQIADFASRNDANWRAIQSAQAAAAARLKGVEVVRSADVCESCTIHPRDKSRLARRLNQAWNGRTPARRGDFACSGRVFDVKDIFAPIVVGVPPTFAARDMCVTADGEIRHYGRAVVGNTVARVYVASRDGGLSWRKQIADRDDVGPMVRSPWSGDWLYFTGMEPVTLVRSKVGPGDRRAERIEMPWRRLELRQLLPLKSRRRWIAAFSDVAMTPRADGSRCYHATTAYSDDDGRTWTRTDLEPVAGVARLAANDRRPHWFNNGCEPTVAELADGTLVLCARTSGPHAAFYRSTDGGATWGAGKPDPAFWQANTMPYFFRLKDGRLLFFWNNTEMLPTRALSEYPELDRSERDGTWETVFSNRDALHAAISDDDGKTWRGFREIILNEIRNAGDFRELGNFPHEEQDKSVHQTQAIELPGGKVLLALGQNVSARRLVIFDPDWLLETTRREDFRRGLGGLSNHLYVRSLSGGPRGWAGHCAWNRMVGATLVRDPHTDNPPPGEKPSVREVLQLCRIRDPRLVSDRQGIVWNFPAARKGEVSLDCRIVGAGFRLTLADHWMNPSDELSPLACPLSIPVDAPELRAPGYHRLTVAWEGPKATLRADGRTIGEYPLAFQPRYGLSYLHLLTLAEDADAKGTYFREFSMTDGSTPIKEEL